MADTTITLTDAELQARIDTAVKEATKGLISKEEHDGQMATMRKKYDADLQKEKDRAKLDADERARVEAEEKNQETLKELEDLRSYKKSAELGKRLEKEGLPSFFVNDQRLLSAEGGDLDKAIKVVKGEYDANKPQGNTHSSVVQVGGKAPASAGGEDTAKREAFEAVGEQIANLVK